MAGKYEKCGAKKGGGRWITCNRKAGHKGEHADTKISPATYWRDDK